MRWTEASTVWSPDGSLYLLKTGLDSLIGPTCNLSLRRHPKVTVKKPHESLSPKAILRSQTPFASLLERLREIAEKRGSVTREAGSNPVVYREP